MRTLGQWIAQRMMERARRDPEKSASRALRALAGQGLRRELLNAWGRGAFDGQAFLGALNSGGTEHRLLMAVQLGLTGDRRVISGLLMLMHVDATRYPAAVTLGMLGEAEAIPVLIEALEHEHPDVRFAAAMALADAGAPAGTALATLRWVASHDPDKGVVQMCLGALGHIAKSMRLTSAELVAGPTPSGRGTEPEAVPAPAGRGTEPEAASAPRGRGTKMEAEDGP